MGLVKFCTVVLLGASLAGCCGHGCHQHVYRDMNNEPNGINHSKPDERNSNYDYNLKAKSHVHQNQ